MDFKPERAKDAAIDTGAAVVGAVAGLAVSKKITEMITQKAPASTLGRHVPAALLALTIGVQAMGIVPDNKLIDSALQGVAVTCGMQAVREYTSANDPDKIAATSGLAHLVNLYVPAFTSDGQAATAVLPPGTGTNGFLGLGNVNYREPAEAIMLAAQEQQFTQPGLRQLGMPAAGGATIKDVG